MRKVNFLSLLCSLALLSCGPDIQPVTPPGPGPETPDPGSDEKELPDFSKWEIPDPFELPFGASLNIAGKGLKPGDEIRLSSHEDASKTYVLKCIKADDEKGGFFTVPDHFIGGMCSVDVAAGGRTLSRDCFVSVVDTVEVEKVPGRTSYGRVIDWEGKPLQGVVVSDGVLVTTTDEQGCWYLASMRKNGYVFISVPKNYRVAVNRTIPQFYQNFKDSRSSVYERHNFILEPENNSAYRMIAFTDCHLAARTNDVKQFNNFKADLQDEMMRAKADGVKLYALTLGDLAWDEYWYANSFSLENYYEIMSDVGIPVYNTPGNHDNDPSIPDDFLAEAAFRKWLGPTYYSFNLGDTHYVMMDNTLFSNSGASQSSYNVQDYKQGFTSSELKWLAADLAHVPAGTTVMFCNHIQYSGRPSLKSDGSFSYAWSMPAEFRAEMLEDLAPFNVHFLTGHTHVNYTNRFSDKMIEHNIAAVCGTWWWTGYYTSSKCHMCRDGAPAGYKIFDFAADGSMRWIYKGIKRDRNYQFRAYDLNNCLIDRATYCPASSSTKVSDDFYSEYVHGYDKPRSDNHILVNVFDYDDNWTVSIRENGRELTVQRVDTYDPLHIIHFNTRRMKSNSTAMTFPTLMTSHMFEATASSATSDIEIIVTDALGRTYSEIMKRPRMLLDMSKASNW